MRIAAVAIVAVVVVALIAAVPAAATAFGTIVALGSVAIFAWAAVGLVAPHRVRLSSRWHAGGLWAVSVVMLVVGSALLPEPPPPTVEELAAATEPPPPVAAELPIEREQPSVPPSPPPPISPPLEDWQFWQFDRAQFEAMCSAGWLGNERDSVLTRMESASIEALGVQPGDPVQKRWDAIVAANQLIDPINYYANLFRACRAHQEQFDDPAVAQALAVHESEVSIALGMATQLQEMVDVVEEDDICLRVNRAGQVWNETENRFDAAPARCPSVADFEDGTAVIW